MNRESFKEHLRRRLHEMLSADDRALTSSTEPNLSDEDRAKEHFDHSDRKLPGGRVISRRALRGR